MNKIVSRLFRQKENIMTSFPFNFKCDLPGRNSIPSFSNYCYQPQFPSDIPYRTGVPSFSEGRESSEPLHASVVNKAPHSMPNKDNAPPVKTDERCVIDATDSPKGQSIPVICGVKFDHDKSPHKAQQKGTNNLVINTALPSAEHQKIHPGFHTEESVERNTENILGDTHSKKGQACNVEVFSCSACYKGFAKKEHLSRHIKIHLGEKPYTCDTCQKSFSRKEHLHRHSLTHTGEKLFGCDVCGKHFSRKEHLKRHYLLHTQEKTFQCDKCSNFFYRKAHLERHLRTHTGEKPFVCVTCEKSFCRKVKLEKHSTVHTEASVPTANNELPNKKLSFNSDPTRISKDFEKLAKPSGIHTEVRNATTEVPVVDKTPFVHSRPSVSVADIGKFNQHSTVCSKINVLASNVEASDKHFITHSEINTSSTNVEQN